MVGTKVSLRTPRKHRCRVWFSFLFDVPDLFLLDRAQPIWCEKLSVVANVWVVCAVRFTRFTVHGSGQKSVEFCILRSAG